MGRKPRIDQQLVATLTAKNITQTQIAKQLGCTSQRINQITDISKSKSQIVKEYLQDRTNIFRYCQKQFIDLILELKESLHTDLKSDKLTPGQKSQALAVCVPIIGTLYDKERLETGKSTQNTAVLHQFMKEAHEKV